MSIQTNKLKINFNIDAIERDFAFIRLKREQKNYFGAHQLDRLLGEDYQATAVMWQYGGFAYAMFKRPVNIYELISKIRNDENFSNEAVIEALPRANRTEADGCICEAWLAQILLNSLASSRSRYEQFHYCNLTGALLIVPDLNGKSGDFIDAAKVVINKDYLLNVQIIRHRKLISVLNEVTTGKIKSERINNKPRYILHESTGTLRRLLPSDGDSDTKETYIELAIKGKKASVPFLDFQSSQHYEKSRAGILHQVLDNIQEHLSDYMSVTLSPLETPHSIELKETILKNPKQLQSKLIGQPIRIVNRVNSEESYDLVKSLQEALSPYMMNHELLTVGETDRPGSLNLRIIHDADYYAEIGNHDEHLASRQDINRQHITIESAVFLEDAVIKTIVKELLIKRDIGERNLRLFDWSKLNAKRTWTFAINDDKSKRIVFMDISPDGHFEFRKLDGNDLFGDGKYQDYVGIINEAENNKFRTNLFLEGLVISEDGAKNLIFRTEEITIPDLINIKKIIAEKDAVLPEGKRTGNELALIVEQCFAEAAEVENDKLVSLIEELRLIGVQELSKTDFRIKLNAHLGKNTKMAEQLRSNLYNIHRIRLSFPKKKDSLNTLFDASLNIKYFGETDSEAYYFVGDRRENVQFSIKEACHLRKVVAVDGSKLIFKELLPTMNVDFVRTGQSTVVPFPFKYLREYMKFEENKENRGN
jgi:hypothetical protein